MMTNLTQTMQSLFAKTPVQAGVPLGAPTPPTAQQASFAPGQQPMIGGGLASPTRMGTYNEQLLLGVMDDSYSMEGEAATALNKALEVLLAELGSPKNKDGFRVSVIRFASDATLLADAQAPQDVRLHFDGSSGCTNGAPGLRMAKTCDSAFTARKGRRRVPSIVVFMSDGGLADTDETLRAAQELKDAGVSIISIGLGSGADGDVLRRIASTPQHYAHTDIGQMVGLFAKVGKTVSLQLSQVG